MIELRASKLPLLAACPASRLPLQGPAIGGSEEAADLGSAAHAALAVHVHGETPDLAQIASEWAVDFHELERLFKGGCRLWEPLEPFFRPVQTEVELSLSLDDEFLAEWDPAYQPKKAIRLTGHIDVISVIPEYREVRIADWKTGRVESDHLDQMRAYGLLALYRYPECQTVFANILRVREGTKEEHSWTRPELWAWWSRFTEKLGREDYSPGTHCTHCPRALECPALQTVVDSSVRSLLSVDEFVASQVSYGISLGVLLGQVKLIEKACERARDAIKARVQSVGGSMPIDDQSALVIREEERRVISAPAAWEILRSELGEGNLIDCVRLGKEAVLEKAKALVGRGQKGKAAAQLMDRLDQAGAIGTQIIEKLEIRRVKVDSLLPEKA